MQQFLSGMKWKFFIDGKELPNTFWLKLPIMVMMGDMPFLDKLDGFCGGNNIDNFACQLCYACIRHFDDAY